MMVMVLQRAIETMLRDLQKKRLQGRLVRHDRLVHPISLLQKSVDRRDGLLAVLVVLNRVHRATRSPGQGVIKLGVLAEPTRVTKERVLLVVVDGPALVALEDVLAAVGADARIGGHRGGAAGALQRLGRGLDVVVEIGVLDHEVARDDGQGEVHLDLGLALTEGHPLRLVPHGRLVLQLDHGLHRAVVVEDVDGPQHFRALEVADAEADAPDGVAADELHDLRRRRELGVHLQ